MDETSHDEIATRRAVARVLSGEIEAYREIVRRYETDVFAAVVPLLGTASAAEDLVQETFLTSFRRLRDFNPAQPFRPWLLGITRNLVRNELRRRYRESARLEVYECYLETAPGPTDDDHRQRLNAALEHCRRKITGIASDALRWRYDDDLGLEDVARRIGRSVTATRQLLYRTRLALRDCIESQMTATEGPP